MPPCARQLARIWRSSPGADARGRFASGGPSPRPPSARPTAPIPETRRRGRNHGRRAAPSAAAAPAGRARARSAPRRCPPALLGRSRHRTRGGSAWSAAPGSAAGRPCATGLDPLDRGSKSTTIGRSSRGALPSPNAQPNQGAAEPQRSPNQPSARCAGRRAKKPNSAAPPAAQTGTPHSPGRSEREPGGDARAEADDEPRRKLPALASRKPSTAPRAAENAPSNSPEHAVEEAHPLC